MALQRGCKAAPENIASWQNLGNAYILKNKLAAAEEIYHTISTKWPQQAEGPAGLAAVYRLTGRYQQALEAARLALKARPDDPLLHYLLGGIIQEIGSRLAYPQNQLGLLQEGYSHLKKADASLPGHPDASFRLGLLCMLLSRPDEATRALEKAAQITPKRAPVWLALSRARLRSSDVNGSIKAATRARTLNPSSAEAEMSIGRALLLKSDPASLQAAVASFSHASQLAPDLASCRERLGTALLRLQRVEEARQAFEQAYRLDQNDTFAVQQLAQIYRQQGDTQKAKAAVQQAQLLTYNDGLLSQAQRVSAAHPENWRLRLGLASRYHDLGWNVQAEQEYLTVLALDPSNADARQGLQAVRQALSQQRSGDEAPVPGGGSG